MKHYLMAVYCEHFRGYEGPSLGFDGTKDYICEDEIHTAEEVGNTYEEIDKWAYDLLREYILDGIDGYGEEFPAYLASDAECDDEDEKVYLTDLTSKLKFYINRAEKTDVDDHYTLALWEFENMKELMDETNDNTCAPDHEPDYEVSLWMSGLAKEILYKKSNI